MKRYLDTVILGLGLFFFCFGVYLVYERQSPRHFVYAASEELHSVPVPVRLTISDLSLDLPIYPAEIKDHKWEITREGVSYLSTSPLPGSLGNSVMYGHNWGNLLSPLKHAKVGQTIRITLSDGTIHSYLIHFVSVVTSDQTHIYSNTPDYRLTLYTCTGFLDRDRLVVTALLAE